MRTRDFLCALTLFASLATWAESSWRISIKNSDVAEAMTQLREITGYEATNPTATCLKETVTYQSDRSWKLAESEELIRTVLSNACCDVTFEDRLYTLTEAETRNAECLSEEAKIVYGNCEGATPLPDHMIADHPMCAKDAPRGPADLDRVEDLK